MKIKKVYCGMLSLMMAGIMLFPMTVMAAPVQGEISITDIQPTLESEELATLESGEPTDDAQARSDTWFNGPKIELSRISQSTLSIYAETVCYPGLGVTKCGFSELTLQRRPIGSGSSWQTYNGWGSQYVSGFVFKKTIEITVPSGYEYRVNGVHYAYISLFNTQSAPNTSNVIAI